MTFLGLFGKLGEISLFPDQTIFYLYGRPWGISVEWWILQNFTEEVYRTTGWLEWKGSLEIIKPLLEQLHPEQFAQDCVQACYEYLQRKRIHSLSGLLQGSATLSKEIFPSYSDGSMGNTANCRPPAELCTAHPHPSCRVVFAAVSSRMLVF